jgi:hypothetical protein
VIDFEIVIHKAVNFKWPTAKIIGCRFHLAQGTSMVQKNPIFGINKILQKSQFSREAFLKLFLGTPFLKPSDVEEYFLGLCEILPCNNSGIVQFSDYTESSTRNQIESATSFLFYRNVFLSWISRFYLLAVDTRFVGCLPRKNLSLIAFINFL